MKKISSLCIAGMLVIVLSLQSCLDDGTYNGENLLFAVGTVKVIEGQEYYFELDEGSLLYPSDTTSIHNYDVKDDQRAFIYFGLLDEELPGYEYNAKLEHIENILTKDIIRMTPDMTDSIGNDRIDIDNVWLTENHVNIVYKIYHSNNPEKLHMLNLVIDEADEVVADGYLHLEFRHNAYEDSPLVSGPGIVSFKLDNVRDLLENVQGICIHASTLYNGSKSFFVDKSLE